MRRNALLFMVLLCFTAAAASDGAEDLTVFTFNDFYIRTLPAASFYPTFLEAYAPDTTLLIEESNGFAWIDPPRVYFEGDSYRQFNWDYNGFSINSALNPGTPSALLPPSALTGYRLQGESPLSGRGGLGFLCQAPQKSLSRLTVSTIYSDLGSYSPWADFLITTPATQRADRLYNERRKPLNNFYIDYLFHKKFSRANWLVALHYFDMDRQFNDFNAFDRTFTEQSRLFAASSHYSKETAGGRFEAFGIFNYAERTNLGAETGAYPQETIDSTRRSLAAGLGLYRKWLELKLHVQYESEERQPAVPDFSKDFRDNDGDGLYSFARIGTFSAATVNLTLELPHRRQWSGGALAVVGYAAVRYSQLGGQERVNAFNPIFFGSDPYLVLRWDPGREYHNSNARLEAGVRLSADISPDLSLISRLFVRYSDLRFDYAANNLSFFSPGYDIGLLLFKNRKTRILFSYGDLPYDIREDVNVFLEQDRPSGTYYHWQDGNGDLAYQAGEEGTVFGYSGGNCHFVDEAIAAPRKRRLLLDLSTRLSRHWRLNVKGIYKKMADTFWIKFARDYGFYESYGGQDLYFFDQTFKDYTLSNYDFDDDPFYAQLLLHFKGERPGRWFFSFSFLAHIGMGYTAFGNGVGANDIGVIHESQAFPNTWINGFGRLDGDRAFVARLYAGFYLARNLSLGIGLKYRDGHPFAFFNALNRHDQWAIYYQTIQAENEKGEKGGPREDYVSDISLKLNYRFRLFNRRASLSLSAFNLLDVGYELSEYVWSGGSRDAVELVMPRSLRLTLMVEF